MFWLYRWGLYLRTVLLILICMARNALWGLEQPANSLLVKHPRFEWLANHVCYVTWPIGFLCIYTSSCILNHPMWQPRYSQSGSGCSCMGAQHPNPRWYTAVWGRLRAWIWENLPKRRKNDVLRKNLFDTCWISIRIFKLIISFYPCLPPEKEFVIIVGEMICAPGDYIGLFRFQSLRHIYLFFQISFPLLRKIYRQVWQTEISWYTSTSLQPVTLMDIHFDNVLKPHALNFPLLPTLVAGTTKVLSGRFWTFPSKSLGKPYRSSACTPGTAIQTPKPTIWNATGTIWPFTFGWSLGWRKTLGTFGIPIPLQTFEVGWPFIWEMFGN